MANLELTWVVPDIADPIATLSANIFSESEVRQVNLPANTVVDVRDLDPGKLIVSGRLPSGETLHRAMLLPQKGPKERVELVSPNLNPSGPKRPRFPSLSVANSGLTTRSVAELIDRGWLRLWVYEASRKHPWTSIGLPNGQLSLKSDSVTVGFTLDSWSTKPAFLEVGGFGPLSIFSAVPPVPRFSAEIWLRGDADTLSTNSRNVANLDIASIDSRHSAVTFALRALEGGGFDSARATFKALMRRLLIEKFVDPYGAIAGCYFLILNGDADELDDMPWRLYMDAAKDSPDSALLYAWQQMLRPTSGEEISETTKIEEFKSALQDAVKRGVPVFSAGLRFIFERLRGFEASVGSHSETRQRISETTNHLGRRLDASDSDSVLTKFTGVAPWAPMTHAVYEHLRSKYGGDIEDLSAPGDAPTNLSSLT